MWDSESWMFGRISASWAAIRLIPSCVFLILASFWNSLTYSTSSRVGSGKSNGSAGGVVFRACYGSVMVFGRVLEIRLENRIPSHAFPSSLWMWMGKGDRTPQSSVGDCPLVS